MSAGKVLVGGKGRGWLARTPLGLSWRLVDDIDLAQRFEPEEGISTLFGSPDVLALTGPDVVVMEIVGSWRQTRANAINAVGVG